LSPAQIRADSATPVAAILYVLATGVIFAALDACAKHLVLAGMSAPFVSWVRFVGHVALVLVLMRAWANPNVTKAASLPRQFLRGLFLFGSTILNFAALRTLQLAETSAIFFFAPMVITALAGPLLGEWAGWRRWLAVAIGFVGVLVITRPGFGTFGIGHVYVLCAMVSYCLYVITTRRYAASETAESLILYSALAPVIFMLPVVPFTASMPPTVLDGVILAVTGVLGGLGHWCVVLAYRQAGATALAPYPYLQMVWMILLGYLVFNQFPDGWTLAGAGIIVASGLYIVHREHRLRVRNRAAPNAEIEDLAGKS
jgi:drug/metabolite transporter (DMT)-like permease